MAKRYDRSIRGAAVEREFPDVDAFIADIVSVCRKHGMSISHEDGHGAFIIERLSESNIEWLEAAPADLRPMGDTP